MILAKAPGLASFFLKEIPCKRSCLYRQLIMCKENTYEPQYVCLHKKGTSVLHFQVRM